MALFPGVHLSIKSCCWDRIPTDPGPSKLRSSYDRYSGFFGVRSGSGSDRGSDFLESKILQGES